MGFWLMIIYILFYFLCCFIYPFLFFPLKGIQDFVLWTYPSFNIIHDRWSVGKSHQPPRTRVRVGSSSVRQSVTQSSSVKSLCSASTQSLVSQWVWVRARFGSTQQIWQFPRTRSRRSSRGILNPRCAVNLLGVVGCNPDPEQDHGHDHDPNPVPQ